MTSNRIGVFIFFLLITSCTQTTEYRTIPLGSGWGTSPEFIGLPAIAQPMTPITIPAHPYLAAQGQNGMHQDSYCTEVSPWNAPLGKMPIVRSRALATIGGEAATVTFDAKGRLICISGNLFGFRLLLMDPLTLDILAETSLPQRESMKEFLATGDWKVIMKDTSGGAYFHLMKGDKPIIAASDNVIRIFRIDESSGRTEWRVESEFDVKQSISNKSTIVDAMPDWKGNIWFITRDGYVGTIDANTGGIRTIRLVGEEIQNAMAIAEDGIYIVSDFALYRFETDVSNGNPKWTWREVYDRGTKVKPGSINMGSGTTPTLIARDYVAITDNADGRVNVMVYKRRDDVQGERLLCKQPVFDEGRSTSENSLISYSNSLIVENNYLYSSGLPNDENPRGHPGIARVDFDAASATSKVVWESREVSMTTVPKLSSANGLIYLYTRLTNTPTEVQAWYLTAIDFRTGKTVFKILTGTGKNYNNNYAPITLAPNGTAVIGCFSGIITVRDDFISN